MAININLKKNVISNKHSNEIHVKDFKKLTVSEESFDEDKLKSIYDNIFYEFPKKGKKSHREIVHQSYDYIHASTNKQLDNNIEKLSTHLFDKNDEIFELSQDNFEKLRLNKIFENNLTKDDIYGLY